MKQKREHGRVSQRVVGHRSFFFFFLSQDAGRSKHENAET